MDRSIQREKKEIECFYLASMVKKLEAGTLKTEQRRF